MRAPYDPIDAAYVDEKDVRDELSRVFDVCGACRRCLDFCDVFPSLFDLLDALDAPDAGRMTPAEQDRVVDACFDCGRCVVGCPYAFGRHEQAVDVPRLVLRANAMRRASGQISGRRRLTDRFVTRPDRVARGATRSSIVRRMVNAAPGSRSRRFVAMLTGVSAERDLPRPASRTWSAWMAERTGTPSDRPRGRVTVFPTCGIEYVATDVGRDLVAVLEHVGVACSASAAGCCGAPSLRAGDIDRFAGIAKRNVRTLTSESSGDVPIVVAQPTCREVIRSEYVRHIGGTDAATLAERTVDPAEYLLDVHASSDALDMSSSGDVPVAVAHLAHPTSDESSGCAPQSLIALSGAHVTLLEPSSGAGGAWGLRAENDRGADRLAGRLVALADSAGDTPLTGDDVLANAVIEARTGRQVSHPVQVIARACGIPDDGPA